MMRASGGTLHACLGHCSVESYNYARGANQNSEDMMQNAKQYCALHGYDYLTTPKSYPLLTGEQGS